jgi:hypothetical protein
MFADWLLVREAAQIIVAQAGAGNSCHAATS